MGKIKKPARRCKICRKSVSSSKTYCSKTCSDKADWIRRKKRIDLKKPVKLCKNCGNPIVLKKRRVFCCEDCADAFFLDVRREQYQKIIKQKICIICGETCIWSIGKEPSTCKKKQCKLAYLYQKGRNRWGNLSKEEKRKKTDAIIRYVKRGDGEILTSRCPGCGKLHEFRFIPAWIGNGMPRVGCTNYPYCAREAREFDGDPINLTTIFESENRAYL